MHLVFQYINEERKSFKELRYALRSWEAHYKGDLDIIIIGECPGWINEEKVWWIPHKRVPGIYRTNCYDQVSKMQRLLQEKSLSDTFILTYDDIYLLEPVSLEDLLPVYATQDHSNTKHWMAGKHSDLKRCTNEVLRREGLTEWDCENHLPKVFNRHLMRALIKKYRPLENRLLISTLYYNAYSPGPPIFLSRNDYVKAEYHDRSDHWGYNYKTFDDIKRSLKNKKFLNHSDRGLCDDLKRVIKEIFPNRSQYER